MTKQPNFLIIVADDLGFSDLGCFGGEISTPNLDALASNGTRLTSFHTASACSPTRSMLLSGTDHHLAGLGQMAESAARNPGFADKPGYEGVLNDRVAPLPAILRDLGGYETFMAGKWHLGLQPKDYPSQKGFDQSFALLPGAGNHYAFEPANKNGEGPALKFMPSLYSDGDRPVPLDELPSPFYSTEVFTSKLLSQLESRDTDKPFFAYLPYTAPHWPLQAPRKYIDRYRGRYDEGPHALRARRLARLKELGLIDVSIDAGHPLVDVEGGIRWQDRSPEEKTFSSRLMEIYSAMVEYMDAEIGRVVSFLRARGELENTFIFFSSDNGAEGALLEAVPMLGKNIEAMIEKYYDNSLDNVGNANSFTWYGDAWAQAATAPSRMFKAWITEGGIRCPAIISYPPFQQREGLIASTFTSVMDILPTLLDLACIRHPAPTFQGRQVLPPRGRSWAPYLRSEVDHVHSETAIHGWELFGQRAIRKGDLKAVFIPEPAGPARWQLYDLSRDPGETEDLASVQPDMLAQLVEHWLEYEAETGTIILEEPWAPGYGPQKYRTDVA